MLIWPKPNFIQKIKKVPNCISTFYKLWMQTRTKRQKTENLFYKHIQLKVKSQIRIRIQVKSRFRIRIGSASKWKAGCGSATVLQHRLTVLRSARIRKIHNTANSLWGTANMVDKKKPRKTKKLRKQRKTRTWRDCQHRWEAWPGERPSAYRYEKHTITRSASTRMWRWPELKGTGFGFWWHVWLVLGLNRGRGQFLNFLAALIL